MKKTIPIVCICTALFTLVNASVWEGAAAAAAGSELPEKGLYIATNSFPVNTVVDITNLENGKTVRVVASTGLDNPGLLALLSKDAANAIGLKSQTLGQIRMSQIADTAPLPGSIGGIGSGDPDHDPAAFAALNGYDEAVLSAAGNAEVAAPPDDSVVPETGPRVAGNPAAAVTVNPPPALPSDTVPRDKPDYIDPSLIIPPVDNTSAPGEQPPVQLPPGLPYELPSQAAQTNDSFSPESVQDTWVPSGPDFPAPLIGRLEKGRYYLQIGAYSKEETVRSEIAKIDSKLPLAIMNAGSPEKPVYRILIGPVNLGESGALLQRFKSTYKDAFVRLGS
ncbi:MAG: SPOR domain-containing protein [Treponema sp.]|nr:SPOR domain-containing protein [Treponema sp.]